ETPHHPGRHRSAPHVDRRPHWQQPTWSRCQPLSPSGMKVRKDSVPTGGGRTGEGADSQIRFCREAAATASARLRAFSRLSKFSTYVLMVFSLRCRRLAIIVFEYPSLTSWSTSCSRGDRRTAGTLALVTGVSTTLTDEAAAAPRRPAGASWGCGSTPPMTIRS